MGNFWMHRVILRVARQHMVELIDNQLCKAYVRTTGGICIVLTWDLGS